MNETINFSPEIPEDNFPKLSEEALVGIPGQIVQLASENSEASPAALLFTALAFAAASLGPVPYFYVGDTKHPARLFVSIVGQSSRARKGTSQHPIQRIFEEAERIGRLAPLTTTPGPFSSGEGIIHAVRDPSKTMKKDQPIDMGVKDKRLLGLLGEFGGTLATMEREGTTLSAVLRTAWDTGDIRPLTKNCQIETTNSHINFVGHITKLELDKLLSTSDVWNGFANRILWVCARRNGEHPCPVPMPKEEVTKIAEQLAESLEYGQRTAPITQAPDAEELWKQLYSDLTTDEPGKAGVIACRAEAQVIRLSMIYALLDKSSLIYRKHLEAGLAAWDYCAQSTRYLFGTALVNPREQKLLEVLQTRQTWTKTDIHNIFQRNIPAVELNALLAEMESSNKIIRSGQGRGAIYSLSNPQDCPQG